MKRFHLQLLILSVFISGFPLRVFSQDSSVLIGNFYYNAPNGIAFIKNGEAAFVMDPLPGENKYSTVVFQQTILDNDTAEFYQNHLANPYNAGVVAPDDSYHRMIFELSNNGLVDFEWSRVGDCVVGRLKSDSPQEITFSVEKNWPGLQSSFSPLQDGIEGIATTSKGEVNWVLKSDPYPIAVNDKSITFTLAGGNSASYFVAGFGTLPSIEETDGLIDKALGKYEETRPRAVSPMGDFVGAMTNNLNNSRLYSNNDQMLAITVSRHFGVKNANLYPIFCWDSFFNGLMASVDNPKMAKATFRAILDAQYPNGMVPGVTHWFVGPSTANSQPPVGSMCIWKAHLRHPDPEFLAEVYPKLAKWHSWWMKNRNAKGDSLLQWGSEEGTLQHAMYETGWDDTPHFVGTEGVKIEGKSMNVYAVDLNSMWALDAHYLSLMADALGKKADAEKYRKEKEAMNKRINARLWNEERGVYCSRFFNDDDGNEGAFLTRLAPLNFYPLISGAANAAQAESVLSIMSDPDQFWGEWILPTISFQDPAYQKQRYWSGTIWAPSNYLVWLGVKQYGSPELQAEYAQKSVNLFMNNWLGAGLCGENYFGINGRVCSNPNYTWGALLCLIGLESVLDMDDQGNPFIGNGLNVPVVLKNIPVMDEIYDAKIRFQKEGTLLKPIL